MIYGNVYNEFFEQQAKILPWPIQNALHFLKETDFTKHETGAFPMELDGVPVILQVLSLETKPREELRPEIHRKNIDIQFLANDSVELASFYNDDGTNSVDEDLLDTPRDILFYKNNDQISENLFELTKGTYAVYFPWDVHVPAIQKDGQSRNILKIVIKVPMDACI